MKPLREAEFRGIAAIALAEAGLHLPAGKEVFVASRLQRRLRATGLADFAAYLGVLTSRTTEAQTERKELISALTTNVTGAFRESHHFEALAEMLRRASPLQPQTERFLRIWSAGCSSGEEALSIAATCLAVRGPVWSRQIRILATDIDPHVLAAAAARTEDRTLLDQLRAGAAQFGARAEGLDRMNLADLGSAITYMRHNLLDPLPVTTPFDVIFCRNVTIYFAPTIQREVHARLQALLAPGGLLAIGHSERLHSPDPGIRLVGTTTYMKQSKAEGLSEWR